jgi:hypothetical protein
MATFITLCLSQCRSTSDPRIAKEIKSLISIPYFISPMNSESDLTWIFMGAPGPGASMHVRYKLTPPTDIVYVCHCDPKIVCA